MINHITLRVKDLDQSKQFYMHALAPLGYKLLADGTSVGFGIEDIDGKRDFWIKPYDDLPDTSSFSCLAFAAQDKRAVNAFYDAALHAGGKDNGAPGYRPQYSPGYYAAYVIDPNGYNIEVVFDDPDPQT